MNSKAPSGAISQVDWVLRCAARIRELDDVVSLVDATDVATTLHDLPCCEFLDPESAAARLFQGNLAPSRWADLSTFCETKP